MKNICCKKMFSGYYSHTCGKTAKFEVDGNHYCGIHNPNKAETKGQIDARKAREMQRAKWRLESSAPDLLEALREYRKQFPNHEDEAFMEETQALGRMAREAIAKATGGQS